MSVQNIPQQSIPSHKGLGLGQDYTKTAQHKALGQQQGASNELVSWYDQAYAYYKAVENGSEPMPDQAAWQEFLNQMNWAYNEIWGGGAGGAWDPMAGGGGAGPAAQGQNEFGGTMGPNGEWVYTQKDTNIGVGGGGVHNVFGFNNNIYISSTAAQVTLAEVMQGEPPEKVIKMVVVDEATGEEEVFYFHNVDDMENLNIQAANPNGVDIQIENPALAGKITVEEFDGVDLSNGTPGIPEGSTIEDGTAIHEGLHNDIYPPFGNVSHHEVWGNMNLSVKGSDEVLVEKLQDGRYEITVTGRDGEQTTFIVAAGNHININANPNQVTFKQGAEGLSVSGELAPNGGAASGGMDGAEGVPEGFEEVSLNGETGPVDGTGENDLPDGIEEWPEEFFQLLEEMGLTPDQVNLSPALMNEIKTGILPPSAALLDALAKSDATLQSAIEKQQDNPDSLFNKKQVADRLATLLGILYPDAGVTRDPLLSSEDMEDVNEEALAGMIFFSGGEDAFEITVSGGKVRLTETSVDEVDGASDDDGMELRDVDEDKIEAYEEELQNLFGYAAEDIEEKLKDMNPAERDDLWSVLGQVKNGAMPWDIPELFSVMVNVDPSLKSALASFSGKHASGEEHMNVRDALRFSLEKLFPNLSFAAGTGSDHLYINGRGPYDVVNRLANATSENLADWLHWEEDEDPK